MTAVVFLFTNQNPFSIILEKYPKTPNYDYLKGIFFHEMKDFPLCSIIRIFRWIIIVK